MTASDEHALALEHLHLIGAVLASNRRLVIGDYRSDDATSAGWFGLTRAARSWDPERSSFDTWARRCITSEILEDRRRWWGRAAIAAARAEGRPLPGGESLDNAPEAADPQGDPAVAVGARLDLSRAVLAGRAACQDRLDRDLLAALLAGRPTAPVAEAWGFSSRTGHYRLARLRTAMRRAAA